MYILALEFKVDLRGLRSFYRILINFAKELASKIMFWNIEWFSSYLSVRHGIN